MTEAEGFVIRSRTDTPPREHAKLEFERRTSSDRALRATVWSNLEDGYTVEVIAPDGYRFSSAAMPLREWMDRDLGYAPLPEFEDRLEFVHGTWLRRDRTEPPPTRPRSGA